MVGLQWLQSKLLNNCKIELEHNKLMPSDCIWIKKFPLSGDCWILPSIISCISTYWRHNSSNIYTLKKKKDHLESSWWKTSIVFPCPFVIPVVSTHEPSFLICSSFTHKKTNDDKAFLEKFYYLQGLQLLHHVSPVVGHAFFHHVPQWESLEQNHMFLP